VTGDGATDDDVTGGRVLAALRDWLPAQRWFPATAGEDDVCRHLETVLTVDLPLTDAAGTVVRAYVLGLPGGGLLHVPVVLTAPPDADPTCAVAEVDGPRGRLVVHDGARHPAYWRALLGAMEWDDAADRHAARNLDAARPVTGEQSNSSVLLPGVAGGTILKVLRTLAPGPNPDLDVPRALARIGWHGVPRPLAWYSVAEHATGSDSTAEPELHLAVLSELVPGADDGFELACDVARRGVSFAPRATALGALVAELHAALRRAFGTGESVDAGWLVRDLRARAAQALAAADALASRADAVARLLDGLERDLDAAASHGALPSLQRIHGDLHLGQVLHGADGWRVLDFEGEPLRPVAERTRTDLALRDVAGMLRSFDYAAAVGGAADPGWADEARTAFLAGYGTSAASAADGALLSALELDKALYEVVYEVRNRPAWLPIPLRGVDRLLEASGG
jgi:maltokinase